nr:ribonuclease H-like domain-containing protein [Tanacetum cinerariifolium]
LEEFQQPEFEGYGPKTSKNVSEYIPNEVKESLDALLVKERVSDNKDCSVESTIMANCNYHQKERVVSRNNYTMVNYNNSARKTHPTPYKNMAPRAVLMKTGLRPLNTARPVNIAHPKTTVYSARPMSHFSKSAQSIIKGPYQQRTTLTNKSFSQTVNTARPRSVYTARPRPVNTARPRPVNTAMPIPFNTTRPNSAVVNAVRGHPQKENQGYVDSGCSRHMTENMSYLSDFKEFDRGYVTFGGRAKGGRIISKGTLKTASKDETTGILKKFITEIKNLVDKKVKEDPPEVLMADNRTMAQLLQAPTVGYEDAIVILEIAATNFKLKHGLINLVQNKQFFG